MECLPRSDPQLGDVYYYPYIWARQGKGAEPEKDRPCCVAIRLPVKIEGSDVFLLAISTTGYPENGAGIRIPKDELALLHGLDAETETWLTVSEYNAAAHEYEYFDTTEYRGSFSLKFMRDTVVPEVRAMLEIAAAKMKAGR